MSQNKNRDYTSRNQTLSGRVNFAYAVVRQQQVQQGQQQGLNLAPPDNRTSALTLLAEGIVATTPADVARYLEELDPPISSTVPLDTSTVPDPPTNLSAVGGNEHLEISFTQGSDGGSPITNYEVWVTDASGATFEPLNPPQTSSPIYVTGLPNGSSYTIILKAVNKNGSSVASSPVTGTPSGTLEINQFITVGTATWTAPTWTTSVEYLVVGGGGGSGGGFDTGAGGGGGGGEVVTGTLSVVGGTTYTVVVGDGGTAGVSLRGPPSSETSGGVGGTSTFASITAAGGSGGFGSRNQTGGSGAGGAQVVAGSGGGAGRGGGSTGGGGGGGGNGSAGGNKSGSTAGAGGSGVSNSITGAAVTYGAGGNGGTGNTNNAGTAGTANRGNGAKGGGAGGTSQVNGAKGGSGFVAIKYTY